MISFKQRSYQKELMDDFTSAGPEMKQTLHELKIVNKLLGGNKVLTTALSKVIKDHPQPHYHIADIGCGGGDMVRLIASWAIKNGTKITIHALDANPHIIEMAKDNLKDLQNVVYHTADVFDETFAKEKMDIITCTLFTHHFTDDELVKMFQSFKHNATIGLIINDLHRHPLAYYSIKYITKLFSKSEMVKNDGPLSVLRSFKSGDITSVLKKSGWSMISIRWFWAFRWQVIALS
ncbi:methyltransferase domain-containing protein [Anditalea andensis]|uniref:SAM-dependent methyltransferase n=1 Tax=Anditalea andensis TaxID=1048983 RepID=A0A074LIL7_9BACT|nr:methyltransferase domain-containing protein [Anditalea andensis]KEO73607.1 SAM-dependent methyltransferase [Anditalea andensis]